MFLVAHVFCCHDNFLNLSVNNNNIDCGCVYCYIGDDRHCVLYVLLSVHVKYNNIVHVCTRFETVGLLHALYCTN